MGRKRKISATRNLKRDILSVFRQEPKQVYNHKQIAASLSVTDNYTRNLIEETLRQLLNSGDISEEGIGKYKLKAQTAYIIGKVDLTASGAAYIISDDMKEDVYISSRNLNKAFHGDIVKVFLLAQTRGKKPEGEVIEILEEGNRIFVGQIEISSNFAFVTASGKQFPFDVFVSLKAINGAKDGEIVKVKITEWPKRAKNPFGEVVEVLGEPGNNETEMHAILAEFGLPYKFDPRIEEAANQIPFEISEEEIKKRKDFRKILTFTIDPFDAKDFDDALSLEILPNGNFSVGVHIADVTHYVTPGSVLDEEAFERGTSVYLVDRCVPMLPERLSNFICSLRPNEDKLCFSAVFELNADAIIVSQWFGRTIINSDRRYTYEEAQQIIETEEGDYASEMLTLDRLAKKLRQQRFEKGAIAFDKQEVKFKLGENGKPEGIYFKESKDANKLIEEFMLLANKRVAEHVANNLGNKTFVYRIHDRPDIDKLANFSKFIKKFGYKISTGSVMEISRSMNALLDQVKTSAYRDIIETLAVRSMAKAIYSVNNIGHYGLAFSHYSHFTSPIRRYPDMMVHNLLAAYLNDKKSVSEEIYEKKCKHASDMEQRATNAERSSIKYKQVEFMQDKTGNEYEGVISGVTDWGIYVEIIETKCEGMVPIRDLDDDFYTFDEKNYCIRGKHTKKEYRLGDKINIKVMRADLSKKQMDFAVVSKA